MAVLVTSSKKYSSSTLLTSSRPAPASAPADCEAKLEKRTWICACCSLRMTVPGLPGHDEHSSRMGSSAPADTFAVPGVAPSTGELSQLAGQADDPGGPWTLIRSRERPLYWCLASG